MHKMITASLPVKLFSAELLAFLVFKTYYMTKKYDICNVVKEKFGRSQSSYDRMLFIDFIRHFINYHSKQIFAKIFANDVLQLGSDPVISVKLKWASIYPYFRPCVKENLLSQYQNALEILLEDPNASVREAALKSKNITRQREFLDKLNSDEEIRDEERRLRFENDQGAQETKEIEESKKKKVDEIAAKATADMNLYKSRKNMSKSRTIITKDLASELRMKPSRSQTSIRVATSINTNLKRK